jgi:hypothetical protein
MSQPYRPPQSVTGIALLLYFSMSEELCPYALIYMRRLGGSNDPLCSVCSFSFAFTRFVFAVTDGEQRLVLLKLKIVFLETKPLGKRLHGHTFGLGLWVACA